MIDGDEVKRQAQADQMGEQLYTVVYKRRVITKTKTGRDKIKWMRGYRTPLPQDCNVDEIASRLADKMPEWEALDLVPNESIPDGTKTNELLRYGMKKWRDIFSPRQLYCHVVCVEVFRDLLSEYRKEFRLNELTRATFVYLALSFDKLTTYSCRSTRWHRESRGFGSSF